MYRGEKSGLNILGIVFVHGRKKWSQFLGVIFLHRGKKWSQLFRRHFSTREKKYATIFILVSFFCTILSRTKIAPQFLSIQHVWGAEILGDAFYAYTTLTHSARMGCVTFRGRIYAYTTHTFCTYGVQGDYESTRMGCDS